MIWRIIIYCRHAQKLNGGRPIDRNIWEFRLSLTAVLTLIPQFSHIFIKIVIFYSTNKDLFDEKQVYNVHEKIINTD